MSDPQEVKPARRAASPQRRHPHRTTLRWSNAAYARLLAAAARMGMKVGAYIRSRVEAEPPTRACQLPPVDLAAHTASLRAFTKAAVNLNQIARRLNSDGAYVPEELVLLAIRLDEDRAAIMVALGRA